MDIRLFDLIGLKDLRLLEYVNGSNTISCLALKKLINEHCTDLALLKKCVVRCKCEYLANTKGPF